MIDEDMLLKIEKMKMEYIELKNSEEYKFGNDILTVNCLLKKDKI